MIIIHIPTAGTSTKLEQKEVLVIMPMNRQVHRAVLNRVELRGVN